MRYWPLLLLLLAVPAYAAGPYQYNVTTTAVSSTVAPVTVLPTNTATVTWQLCNRASATAAVLCFPYTGSTPGATPAGTMEIPVGSCRGDGLVADQIFKTGWACVLEATGTATVDAISR